MLNITYFNRSVDLGFSINKVFIPLRNRIGKDHFVKNLYVPQSNAGFKSIVKNILYVYKHRNPSGINHITGDIHYCVLGLIGCRSVLTIHDTVILKNAKNKLERVIKWFFWFYLPIKFASKVVCISETTKNDVLNYVNRKDIEVIYNSIGSEFKFNPKMAISNNVPVILHIGCGWNKNLVRVIKSLKDFNCKLRIIGKLSDEVLRLLEVYKLDFSNKFNLSDEEIVKEYIDCDIVSFPSLFEGFGMPIVEAQAIGRPVLCSNLQPMMEVGGQGVCYVNPYNIESIKDGFRKLITDINYRKELIKTGSQNVLKFNSSLISSKYIMLYKSIK